MRTTAALVAFVAITAFAIGRGVHNAQAQGAPTLVDVVFNGTLAVDSEGRILTYHFAEGRWVVAGQAPAGTPVNLEQNINSESVWTLAMSNGDYYRVTRIPTGDPEHDYRYSCAFGGNVFDAPVATSKSSWTRVKRGFR